MLRGHDENPGSGQGSVAHEVPRLRRDALDPLDLFLHLPPKLPTLASALGDFLVRKLTDLDDHLLLRLFSRHRSPSPRETSETRDSLCVVWAVRSVIAPAQKLVQDHSPARCTPHSLPTQKNRDIIPNIILGPPRIFLPTTRRIVRGRFSRQVPHFHHLLQNILPVE